MDKREVVIDVLNRLAKHKQPELKPEMELVGDLGIDSPRALELLLELEEKLGIEISDDDAAKMDTVGDVFRYLQRV